MPSFEAKVLGDFLVAPASLRDFMTLQQFTEIFPKGHRSNPAVKDLYRELYMLREKDIEVVRQDIVEEVKRSKQLRRDYARDRRRMDEANVAGLNPFALQMEQELSESHSKMLHNLRTVHASIEDACESIESQIMEIEEARRTAHNEVQELIGALSDLRHGRFAQSAGGDDLGTDVLAHLKRLEAACQQSAG